MISGYSGSRATRWILLLGLMSSRVSAFVPTTTRRTGSILQSPGHSNTRLHLAEFSEFTNAATDIIWANHHHHHVLFHNDVASSWAAGTITEDASSGLSSLLMAADKSPFKSGSVSYKTAAASSIMMLIIVSLYFIWGKSVIYVRRKIPTSLRPVVDSVIGEIGGLGIVGLVLTSVLGYPGVKKSLEGYSKDYFGEKGILVDNFDFLHMTFFQLGVAFFIASGLMVLVGLKRLDDIDDIQELQMDRASGVVDVTAERLAASIPGKEFNKPLEQPGFVNIWRDVFMTDSERAARTLLMRNLVVEKYPYLPDTFRIEPIIEESFALNMYKIVQLSFIAWIFIIPALAYSNAIDIAHGVVNASSKNTADSVGYFFSTFNSIGSAWSISCCCGIWGYWNCWKMTQIKFMVLPRLQPDPADGRPLILPPPMYDEFMRSRFLSSPPTVQRVEKIWGQPPETLLDELFGQAGAAGLDFYLQSIKLQVWLLLTQLVFFGSQIFIRDLDVFVNNVKAVGDPRFSVVELYAYGSFVVFAFFQLICVAPQAFWNYCLISCFDDENLEELLERTGYGRPPAAAGRSGPPLLE